VQPRGLLRAADFAQDYNSPKCIVRVGCWGPVVNCNVPKRGWMAGIGGCPNVGGVCIACTMPGFPDSRICGICGDNHTTCSIYAQNMAYGIKTPKLAELIINLGEAAEYMFDHSIFQDNLVFVDFCERMVKETNPSLWARAEKGLPIFEENGPENFTGIDIMRTVRSFDPCLPCGVHMYVGDGRVVEQHHSPMLGTTRRPSKKRCGSCSPNRSRGG
jgi:hypothetical protein